VQTVTFMIRSSQANLGGPRDTDAFPESQSNANVIHTVSGVKKEFQSGSMERTRRVAGVREWARGAYGG